MDTCVHGGDGCIGLTLPPLALALGSDFGAVVIRIACSAVALSYCGDGGKARAYVCQCAQLSADHREDSSKAWIAAGSGTEQRSPPLQYRTRSGKANRSSGCCCIWVWADLLYFSGLYIIKGSADFFRTVLWCVGSGTSQPLSSRTTLELHQGAEAAALISSYREQLWSFSSRSALTSGEISLPGLVGANFGHELHFLYTDSWGVSVGVTIFGGHKHNVVV